MSSETIKLEYNCVLCNKKIYIYEEGFHTKEWFEYEGYVPVWHMVNRTIVGGKWVESKHEVLKEDTLPLCDDCQKKDYDPHIWADRIKRSYAYFKKEHDGLSQKLDGFSKLMDLIGGN